MKRLLYVWLFLGVVIAYLSGYQALRSSSFIYSVFEAVCILLVFVVLLKGIVDPRFSYAAFQIVAVLSALVVLVVVVAYIPVLQGKVEMPFPYTTIGWLFYFVNYVLYVVESSDLQE